MPGRPLPSHAPPVPSGFEAQSLASSFRPRIVPLTEAGSYPAGATILEAAKKAGITMPTLYAVVTGNDLPSLDITPVRGLDGVKEATVRVGP